MTFKHEIRKLVRKTGFDVSRYKPATHWLARRADLFRKFEVDLVLDVGANTGQFAEFIRGEIGYRGRIVSFEPMGKEFAQLEQKSQLDSNWEAFHYALGAVESKEQINIAGNSESSSLLPMEAAHLEAAPESRYVGTETVEVRTLDSLIGNLLQGERHLYLKIDTQGFEQQVLAGGHNTLNLVESVQLELSLEPVYRGAASFEELYALLTEYGFKMVAVEEVSWNWRTGLLLQIDGVFHRF